jgi:hypothetical protein
MQRIEINVETGAQVIIDLTQEEIDAITAAQTNQAQNISYAQKRAAEYPPMADYLDGIVKGDQTQIQTYIDACLEVKKKYPK